MSKDFDKAFTLVMKYEGGFVLHRNATETADTYAGIYRKAHPGWEGWEYLDGGKTPPEVSVRKFYYQQFWHKWEKLTPAVAFVLFDASVNMGTSRAVRLAQRVLGVTVDGVAGAVTMAAMTHADTDGFLRLFTAEKNGFYHRLARRKQYALYLKGWLARSARVLREATVWTA